MYKFLIHFMKIGITHEKIIYIEQEKIISKHVKINTASLTIKNGKLKQ